MRQGQPMGQRMDQARARFRRAVQAGEKAQEAMLKAQANFEQTQQEIVQAQQAHAGSPIASNASSTSQRQLGQSLEAQTVLIENMPRGWATRPTGSCNPGVEGNSSDFISDHVPGRVRSFGGRGWCRAGKRAMGPGRGRGRRGGRLRGGARSRRADGGGEAGTQGRGGTRTSDAATEEDLNHGAGGVGERECTTFAGPAFNYESRAESQGPQRTCALIQALASS